MLSIRDRLSSLERVLACRSAFSKGSFVAGYGSETDLRLGLEPKPIYDQIPGRRRASTPVDMRTNDGREAQQIDDHFRDSTE